MEEEAQKALHEAVDKAYLVITMGKKDTVRAGLFFALLIIVILAWAVNHFMPEDE